jgi:hypothetical protein
VGFNDGRLPPFSAGADSRVLIVAERAIKPARQQNELKLSEGARAMQSYRIAFTRHSDGSFSVQQDQGMMRKKADETIERFDGIGPTVPALPPGRISEAAKMALVQRLGLFLATPK